MSCYFLVKNLVLLNTAALCVVRGVIYYLAQCVPYICGLIPPAMLMHQ